MRLRSASTSTVPEVSMRTVTVADDNRTSTVAVAAAFAGGVEPGPGVDVRT